MSSDAWTLAEFFSMRLHHNMLCLCVWSVRLGQDLQGNVINWAAQANGGLLSGTHVWNCVWILGRFLSALMHSVQVIGIWQFRVDGLNYVDANDLLSYFSCKELIHHSRRLCKVQFYSGKELWYGFTSPCVSNIAAVSGPESLWEASLSPFIRAQRYDSTFRRLSVLGVHYTQ